MRLVKGPVRNAAETKPRIISAAPGIFSERGYAQATGPEIAQAAGVAYSLILRYYAGKAKLFGEALEFSLDKSPMRTWSKGHFGARVNSPIEGDEDHDPDDGIRNLQPAISMFGGFEESRQATAAWTAGLLRGLVSGAEDSKSAAIADGVHKIGNRVTRDR